MAIDPAQIKGVLPLPLAQLRAGLPALGNPTNLHKSVSLTQKEFRYGFGNALPEQESDDLYEKWTIPSPARPLFQAAAANFVMHSQARINTARSLRHRRRRQRRLERLRRVVDPGDEGRLGLGRPGLERQPPGRGDDQCGGRRQHEAGERPGHGRLLLGAVHLHHVLLTQGVLDERDGVAQVRGPPRY